MPTYEYRCPSGHDFERFYRKISDAAPAVTCPECGKVAERIMSAGGGLLFKGSGFYLTDYGKNAHRGGAAPKADGGGDTAPASSEKSGSTEGSSSKESSTSSKESSASKESTSSKSSGDSKPAAAPKPAESKSKSESKPAKSSGSKSSKDK